MNIMKNVEIEKLTLNIGAGKSQDRLEKGVKLLKMITGIAPVKTVTKKRIPAWNLRPGLPVGCKLTIRKNSKPLITTLLKAKGNVLKQNNFDEEGNVSFGIHEYIDIPGIRYEPEIGMMGLQVCISLKRRGGYRTKYRKEKQKTIPARHRVTQEDAVKFMEKEFGIKIGGEE